MFENALEAADLPTGYRLRAMQLADIDQVHELERQTNPSPWSREQLTQSLQSSHHCVVISRDCKVLAYAVFSTVADEAEVLNIAVSKGVRRQGFASLLIKQFLQKANDRCKMLFLEVRKSNTAARKLYDSLGFNEMGVREKYYPATAGKHGSVREDAVIYGYTTDFRI